MQTAMYLSPKIKCDGCADTIHSALDSVPGIQDVQVYVTTKRVTVTYDEDVVTDNQIREQMANAGFPADA